MTPPPRERETRELIERLRSKRRRHQRGRFLLAGIGTVVVLAAIIAGVVLATGWSAGRSSGTTAAEQEGTTTTQRPAPTSTSGLAYTTETLTTLAPGTVPSSSETPTTSATTSADWLTTKVVAIDPGHQLHADPGLEPIGPGSTRMKAKVSSGTSSPTTGTPESLVTLEVGLKLQAALEALGVRVVMTRTTQNVDVSNRQRAEIANQARADLCIRLHCNGSTNRSIHGLFTLYPASIKGWTNDIAAASKQAATIIQRNAIATTGAQDRGLQQRSDLTGFNWSDVPVVLVEMGFMTNPAEDKLLESGAYQDKIVQGLVNGIVEFLRTE